MDDHDRVQPSETDRLRQEKAALEAEVSRLRGLLENAGAKAEHSAALTREREASITGRKRAEEEHRYQLDLTRTITSNAAEALFLLDGEGRVTFANPAAERMFGWSEDEFLGQALHDMIHHHRPDGTPYPMMECPLGHVFSSHGTLRDHEDVFFHRDGTPIHVLSSNAAVLSKGEMTGAVLVVHNITKRKRAEKALRESEARFRHMADSAPALIWMTDSEGQITFANMG